MAESLLDFIRARFPRAEELAFRRIFARGHTIFFNTRTRKLIAGFAGDEVFSALLIAKTIAVQAGYEFQLTILEEEFFRSYSFAPAKAR